MHWGTYLAVSALAAICAIFYNTPSLVFNLPFGAYPWILLGGHLPPYFDLSVMAHCVDPSQGKCPWLGTGDIIVNSCTKCGTNWMLTTVHELRTVRSPQHRDFEDILQIAPWIDFHNYPAEPTETKYENWGDKWNKTDFPFKLFKGHFFPHEEDSTNGRKILAPVRQRRDVKYLVMVRNPNDMIFSFGRFMDMHEPAWFRSWGNLPVPSTSVDDFLKGLNTTFSNVVPHRFFKEWYEYKDDPNVLILHYSNVFNNLDKYLRVIANFIGVDDLTDAEFASVKNRVGIEFMKTRTDRYRHFAGKNRDLPLVKHSSQNTEGGLIREGGTGTNKLTALEAAEMHYAGVFQVGEKLTRLLEEGFEYDEL